MVKKKDKKRKKPATEKEQVVKIDGVVGEDTLYDEVSSRLDSLLDDDAAFGSDDDFVTYEFDQDEKKEASTTPAAIKQPQVKQIGRASCRERV